MKSNVYSVDSRLVGERVTVRLYADRLDLWYGQRQRESIPRLRGEGKHRIQYRHIIEWLLRKPGAFENYRYREDLFPSVRFRRLYDALAVQHASRKAAQEYLQVLHLVATGGQSLVDEALGCLAEISGPISFVEVQGIVLNWKWQPDTPPEASVGAVPLSEYDALMGEAAG